MRLHRLRITGFGPFAQTQEVDFDKVSASGLFLIHGATGAGKTSILDAVCFALYAAVPGARASAKASLVSDHASEGVVPEVTLEFTASGRRFTVVRSPEFERVKKRGIGTTTVQARVVLEELVDTEAAGNELRSNTRVLAQPIDTELADREWVNRGTRLDETSMVIKDVVGMGLEQFNKVVLLPQGEFAAFLRAKDEERRGVLQRLFDTQRFSDIEAWFAERRRQGAENLRVARADLAIGLVRVDDVLAGLADLEMLDEDADLISPTWADLPPAELGRSLDQLLNAIDVRSSTALATVEVLRTRLAQTDRALTEGHQNTQRQELAATATRRLEVLDDTAEVYEAAAVAVRLAERAAAVAGHLVSAEAAAVVAETALGAVAASRAAVADLMLGAETIAVGATVEDVDAVVAQISAHSDSLSRLSTLSHQGAILADEAREHAANGVAHEGSVAASAVLLATTRALFCASVTTRDETRLMAADLPTLRSLHKRLARVDQVLVAQRRSSARLNLLQTQADSAVLGHLEAREHVVDLRERRLAGMAAELGSTLTGSAPCPVCGSSAHPEIATSEDTVTAEDVAVADLAQSKAADASSTARSAVAAEQARQDGYVNELAAEEINLTPEEIRAVVADAQAAIIAAQTAAETLPAAEQSVEHLTAEIEQLRQVLDSSAAAYARELALSESIAAKGLRLTADAEVLLSEHAAECPCQSGGRAAYESTTHHRRFLTDLGALSLALRDQVTGDEAARTSHDRLAESLQENGFGSADDVRSASLPADQVSTLTRLLRATEQERAEATALLQQPDVIAALAQPEPDPDALSVAHLEATSAHHDAHRRHTLCEQAQRELRSRAVSVATAVAALGPTEQEAELVQSMADAVGGSGGDNARRLRLSAYVLGARLAEVATFANGRLSVMSDGRYALVHHDGKGSHGARGGLGLRVSDSWTGHTRDTASLSGGESFMASLALALGLGDAVRSEAGGFDLQTLFVDEGFGSLDDESLEQVMSVLDALREGGRTVGIVSHVSELRQRIPSQLHVQKGQSGSTISDQIGNSSTGVNNP